MCRAHPTLKNTNDNKDNVGEKVPFLHKSICVENLAIFQSVKWPYIEYQVFSLIASGSHAYACEVLGTFIHPYLNSCGA